MKDNIPDEKSTRKNLMKFAKECGAQEDLEQLFRKWDTIMALAPPDERKSMAHMAILEIHRLLDIHADEHQGLTINGEVIIPAAVKNDQ